MTTLILDNPELIAQAATISGMPLQDIPADDSPRKPHRVRFHYGFNKYGLDEEDRGILLRHAHYLKQHPEVMMHVHGHADNFGAEEYNQFLSRLRASAAAKVLVREGVRQSQILVTGWGSSRPLARPEDHAANRRLELEYIARDMARAL